MLSNGQRANGSNPFAGRDRVLLYTRGMDLPPATGVELALTSLRRSGETASPEQVMAELFGQLAESGEAPFGKAVEALPSAPPLNRRQVVAKSIEHVSLLRLLGKGAKSLIRIVARPKRAKT